MKLCSICKEEKPIDKFGFDKHEKDGRNCRCKPCLAKVRKQRNVSLIKEGMKVCAHCKQEKSHLLYPKNKQCRDGLHVWCKECFNKKNREYRQKNPTAWEIIKNRNFIKWRQKLGISEEEMPRRRNSGEGYITRNGYLTFRKKGHPCADKNDRVQASHLVIYESTGRLIKKGETVHHINGDTLDNRLENLEIWRSGHPSGQRVNDKIRWCIEFLTEYGYEVKKIE